MMVSMEVVEFASIECYLQGSGELSVNWMLRAWEYAYTNRDRLPVTDDVLTLGKLVEPVKNAKGFRTCGVQVGYDVKMDWTLVPGQMVNLCESIHNLAPSEVFYEYEQIHGFVDGNGRSGALLYLWLAHKLDEPDWPPNCFGDPRRLPGFGAPRN